MTWHIYSTASGNVFFTTDDRVALYRELAYLIRCGYAVNIKEAK